MDDNKPVYCKPAEHKYEWDGIIDGIEYHKCANCPHVRRQFHDVGSGC